MTPEAFIEVAVQGKYSVPSMRSAMKGELLFGLPWYIYAVWDPECWKAVGRVKGWARRGYLPEIWKNMPEKVQKAAEEDAARNRFMGLSRALWEGQTITQYIASL